MRYLRELFRPLKYQGTHKRLHVMEPPAHRVNGDQLEKQFG
jgi:hypothetical protein